MALAVWQVAIFGGGMLAATRPVQPLAVALLTAAHVSIQNALYIISVTGYSPQPRRAYQLLGDQVKQPPPVRHGA